jgi:CheY-like chemotaxis protein
MYVLFLVYRQLVVIAPPDLFVELDCDKWKHIVMNLVMNAIHATSRGSITVRINHYPNKALKVKTTDDQGGEVSDRPLGLVDISVEDTGCGIPKQDVINIASSVRKFFSSHGPEKPNDVSGMLSFGLPLVERLIHVMAKDVCTKLGMQENDNPAGWISFDTKNRMYGSISLRSPASSLEGVCLSRSHFVPLDESAFAFDALGCPSNEASSIQGGNSGQPQRLGATAHFSLLLNVLTHTGGTNGGKTPLGAHLNLEPNVSELTALDLPRNLKILVVDDESSNRKLLVRKFQRLLPLVDETNGEEPFNWVIETASSGEQARAMILDNQESPRIKFDLVTMDEHMSNVSILPSGLETKSRGKGTDSIRELRKQGLDSRLLRIVSVSGSTRPVDIEEFKAAGADDVWPKPVPPSEQLVEFMLRLFPPKWSQEGGMDSSRTDSARSRTYSSDDDHDKTSPVAAGNEISIAVKKIAEEAHPSVSPTSSTTNLLENDSTELRMALTKNKWGRGDVRISSLGKGNTFSFADDDDDLL